MKKDFIALLRHVLLVCLLLIGNFSFADDDIYVAREKAPYSDDDSTFDWNLERFALQLNIASYHPSSSEDYNEFNRDLASNTIWIISIFLADIFGTVFIAIAFTLA